MPFDEDDDIEPVKPKIGIKSQGKSIFDNKKEKPSAEEFEKKSIESNKKLENYQVRAQELAVQFKKIMDDKTLSQNKNIFALEIEKELISKMISLAIEINSDENEIEGMGSLGWVALILKNLISEKDKINQLKYSVLNLENKIKDQDDLLNKIISKLDDK